MNRRQKLVQEKFLNNEEAVIKRLKGVYGQSLKDITGKISDLDKSIGDLQKALADVTDDEIGDLAKAFLGRRANISPTEAKETLQSMIQSKVYQKRYQEALKGQIDGIMDKMQGKEYKIVSEYLQQCYEDGFIGTMFDLQGQGIPLCFPLDQEAMVRAVQLDSKISQGLYSRLGEDVALLKKKITAQVSLGIATGKSYQQIARGLADYTRIGYNNAVRIARTEGHRIQVQGTMDACYKARDKGADVVKQWDSTLDGRTRESHAAVDGEIRELDKRFSNGLMFPGDPSGGAAEVVNCRCALLQRARWALDEAELETLQKRAEYFGLDKSETFEDYKKTYLKAAEQLEATGSAVEKIADVKDFEELDKYLKKTYNVSVDKSVKDLDFATVQEAITGVESVLSEFPELADSIKLITTSKSGVMSCSGEKITFNPAYFKTSGKLHDDCKRASGSRWWVQNASPASIGAHESAHAIEWMMIQKNNAYEYGWQRIDVWNKCAEAKKLVSQACKNIKKTPFGKGKKNAELIGGISRYGQETASETMAEAFADIYANGESANPLSLEIKRLTIETLKQYEGGIP